MDVEASAGQEVGGGGGACPTCKILKILGFNARFEICQHSRSLHDFVMYIQYNVK